MMRQKLLFSILSALFLLISVSVSCSLLPNQGFNYDPDKTYASFLVLDNNVGRASLATMEQHSIAEGWAIGPIEYYKQGTKDFAPILKKLTASKQVTVVWVISSVWDIPSIKRAWKAWTMRGPTGTCPSPRQRERLKSSSSAELFSGRG